MNKELKQKLDRLIEGIPTLSDAEVQRQEERVREEQRLSLATELLAKSNAPKRHLHQQKSLYGEQWLTTLDKCKKFIGTGCLLALIGSRGTGKTQLATELLKHACTLGVRSLYRPVSLVFMDAKETYVTGSKTSEKHVFNSYCAPSLLILDEIQERSENDWENRFITALLDIRYLDNKDTIIISNHNESDLIASLGPSIASRMNETGGIINCNWSSYRA